MPTPTITWGETEEALIREGRSCSLDSYDFTKAYSLDRQRLMSFADGSMVEAGENGFLHGGPGTGKTHLCYVHRRRSGSEGQDCQGPQRRQLRTPAA
ncbi:MAG: ATP-binding protein [Cyanobacteria bacterium]|nr:ATP-binding protein [Cyanobacteriota bacterium]